MSENRISDIRIDVSKKSVSFMEDLEKYHLSLAQIKEIREPTQEEIVCYTIIGEILSFVRDKTREINEEESKPRFHVVTPSSDPA